MLQYLSRKRYESSSNSRKRTRYLYKNSVFFGIKNSAVNLDSNEDSSDRNTAQDFDITQFTLGPEPETNLDVDGGLEKWSYLISNNPVPIKVDFLPLDEALWENNPKLKRDYNIALKFYQDIKWYQNNGLGENLVIKGKIGLSTLVI